MLHYTDECRYLLVEFHLWCVWQSSISGCYGQVRTNLCSMQQLAPWFAALLTTELVVAYSVALLACGAAAFNSQHCPLWQHAACPINVELRPYTYGGLRTEAVNTIPVWPHPSGAHCCLIRHSVKIWRAPTCKGPWCFAWVVTTLACAAALPPQQLTLAAMVTNHRNKNFTS